MSVTVRQTAILGVGAAPPSALLRELVRFGVSDVLLVGDAPPRPALPRDVTITCLPLGTVDALSHARPLLAERFFLCRADAVLDFNLARLLAEDAPCFATDDGIDSGIHLLRRAASGDARAVPVTRLPAADPRPALFLDRDGTLNVDHGYVGSRDRFAWIDGAIAAVRMATEAGWHVFIVTNQSGIARGYYDEPALAALHDWMVDELRRAGGNVDDIRVCPFHKDATIPQYRRASDWRKPAPGMILDLMARWSPDPARCVLVGDRPSDMQAAEAAGIEGRLFTGGSLAELVGGLIRG